MPNHTGLSPESPNKYLGASVYLAVEVTRNREPTGADYRQPETGKLYPFGSFWIVGKNPTTGVQGDLWYLSKIVANVAYWVQLGNGSIGPLLSITVPLGVSPIVPDGTGVVNFTSLGGTVAITGSSASPNNHTINFDLTGGGLAIDQIAVQAATAPGVTPVNPTGAGLITINGAIVAAHSVPIETRTRALNTLNVEAQYASAVASTTASQSGMAHFRSSQFTVDANGFVSMVGGTGATVQTLSDDIGTKALPDGTGNIQLVGHVVEQGATKFSTTVQGTNLVNINPMSPARWIVDNLGFNGTHTTIQSAITSATSGDTILVLPGTFTENLTLKAGVSITGFLCDSSLNGTGNVKLIGNATFTGTGTVNISNIQMQTNSAALLTVSGSNVSIVNLSNVYLNCSNATGISFTSSNASSQVNISQCTGNLGTTGIGLYSMSSIGDLVLRSSFLTNTGNSLTPSSNSAGTVLLEFNSIPMAFSTSSTGLMNVRWNHFLNGPNNLTALTFAGNQAQQVHHNRISSGTDVAISIGAGTEVNLSENSIQTSNANAIDGTGTVNYVNNSFTGTSAHFNATLTRVPFATGERLNINNEVQVVSGTGDPNATITAPQGSLFLRTDGAAATSLYINTDGATTWSAR